MNLKTTFIPITIGVQQLERDLLLGSEMVQSETSTKKKIDTFEILGNKYLYY